AGAGDDGVQAAEPTGGRGQGLVDLGRVADVGRGGECGHLRWERVDERGERGGVPVEQRQVIAVGGEAAGDGGADPVGGAGDEGDGSTAHQSATDPSRARVEMEGSWRYGCSAAASASTVMP